MAKSDLIATASSAEVDELLTFVAAFVGPIEQSPAYRARLGAWLLNNFDLIFASQVSAKRVALEVTPRGLGMLAKLPKA